MRRRLDRERASRLEAEAIAERGLRELYDNQRQLELLEAVAVAANQAASINDVLQFAVTRFCEFTGWPIGHAYVVSTPQDGVHQLKSSAIWHNMLGAAAERFHLETEAMRFLSGIGLPGRVLLARAPAWIIDVTEDANFIRKASAKSAGIVSAFAFPVMVGDEVVAVIEFFSQVAVQPDATLLRLMAQIGTQLGRVVERDRAKDRLIHDASHDALTGLPNRSLFLDRLARSIAQKRRHPEIDFAVLFIDLDRFKIVNDSLGHLAGDRLLSEVAARFIACLRQTDVIARPNAAPAAPESAIAGSADTLARLGGDEFTILLDDLHALSGAVRVAERILGALTRPFMLDGQEAYVGASIGIASSATLYETPGDAMRDADLAMYRAKALGKGRYEVFDPLMHTVAVQRLELESDLRRALQNDEFVLHYQPIVDLRTGTIGGFEALVRWQRPKHGLVFPGGFIDVAEDTGLILFIGLWVLREACRTIHRWQQEFPRERPLTMSVNLSARQFAQSDLLAQIRQIVTETGIQPSSLRLELTESVTMANAERAISILESLRALGIRISIDDFGTGYSSLSYLHKLPLDVLKIDRSFVNQMDGDDGNGDGLQIVNTIMHLARSLEMDVIAEGVETETHVAKLRALGCASGQGYFFSRPVPEAEIQKLLAGKAS